MEVKFEVCGFSLFPGDAVFLHPVAKSAGVETKESLPLFPIDLSIDIQIQPSSASKLIRWLSH